MGDGVTLKQYEEIANPSPAKEVSEILTKEVVRELKKFRLMVSSLDIVTAFRKANEKIANFNKQRGETYATTGVAVKVHKEVLYGGRVCDAGYALIRKGTLIFKTPEFWSNLKRTKKKNHGVVDGRKDIAAYIDCWSMPVKPGDVIVLFSDGFENHFHSRKFLILFKKGISPNFETELQKIDAALVEKDHEKYGHERTILAVEI